MLKGVVLAFALCVWSSFTCGASALFDPEISNLGGLRPHSRVDGDTSSNQTFPVGAIVSQTALPGRQQPLVYSQSTSTQPKRVLIRLKSPASQPYLKLQREQLKLTGKLSRADQQKLTKLVRDYRQGLQKSQAQLVEQLRNKQYLRHVHARFIDLTNTLVISVPEAAEDDIRRLPQVAGVYADNPVQALLDDSVSVTEAPQLWAMRDTQGNALTGWGISVAILDTGVDYTHPDLGGCLGANCKVVAGFNFVEGEDVANFIDKHGHGTHVAGIVAANGVLRGVAPDAQLHAYKVLNDSGSGMESSIIAALEKAVDPDGNPATPDQIDIVNMSLGGPGKPDGPLAEAANNAMLAGTLVIVAAGNSGSNYSTLGSPGNAEQVLTVGATDNQGAIADFSSRGPVPGASYVKPEIVAPGVGINSVAPGAAYSVKSGTSMATPHVAGGAAVLKQLYPDLTAAELKDLLISSALDLGEDIFAQGAGMMKLHAASNTKVLISPRLLSAGRVDLQQPQFSRQIPFRLKNISNSPQSAQLNAPANLPTGATLTLPSITSPLAAGASADYALQLDVDTASLPFAESNSLHHRLVSQLQINGQSIGMPLVFSKAALVEIKWGGKPFTMLFFSDDGSYSEFFFYPCDTSPLDIATASEVIYVKPGLYHMAVSFHNNDCYTINALVLQENIEVKTGATVNASPETAVYDVAIGSVIDKTGTELKPSQQQVSLVDISWAREAGDNAFEQSLSIGSAVGSLMKVSRMSEKVKFNVAVLLKSSGTEEEDYYFLQRQFQSGIQEDQRLNLDARTAAGFEFSYVDAFKLQNGVSLSLGVAQLQSLSSDRLAMGIAYGSNDMLHQPVKFTLFSDLSSFLPGEWYPVFGFEQKPNDDPMAWSEPVFSTGMIAFEDTASYIKLRGPLSQREEKLYQSDNRTLSVIDSGFFFSGSFSYYPTGKRFSIIDANNISMSNRLIRDSQQNLFIESMPYKVLCGQSMINSGETLGHGFDVELDFSTCAKQVWEFEMPTHFQGKKYSSTVSIEMDSDLLHEFTYTLDSPLMQQLLLLTDGKVSRILSGNNSQVRILAKADRWADEELPNYSLIEYSLDGSPGWMALNSEIQGAELVAKLPDVIGSRLLSLRITLRNKSGVTLVQTLNSIALIGNESEPAPTFAVLPTLTIEATGPLTEFSLPAVSAKDSLGRDLEASTTDLGPYTLGVHRIRWQAKNAVGKIAEAVQSLTVKDTTPPILTVPNDLRLTATASLTNVTLGEAVAIDLVDGPVIPKPSNLGPFAAGTHLINWTATDKSGNSVSALQQVVIDPKPQSASSSGNSGNSGSGGGGGGSTGVWLLLLVAFMSCLRRRTP